MNRPLAAFALLASSLLLVACERPPPDVGQVGYRGTAMQTIQNPRIAAARRAANVVPAPQPPAEGEAPLAKDVYQNVQVLTDLNIAEFTRLMLAMTQWVSPEQGCSYCHVGENLADDGIYTKIVARRMLQMTRDINMNWKQHVAQTGVTCYTCHRGKNVPQEVWFIDPGPKAAKGLAADRAGQNIPAPQAALASLPWDPFTPFLLNNEPIRSISTTALPAGSTRNIMQTERTYSLMMHMSQGLGVNCTFCHNSRSFMVWEQSTPQRVTAWHGIRMARALNVGYLEPLTETFPRNRLGPTGDVAKINCATCHQGVNKPLYGAPMSRDYPELTTVKAPAEPRAEPADDGAGAEEPATASAQSAPALGVTRG
jgi:photosynthetic reaction center cytochrome c subunit